MAGYGTRLRPHTWSKPKPLVSVAGKTVLDHVFDILGTVPDVQNAEFIFIVGYLGDQVETFMQTNYPDIKAHFVEQEERRGQSHAIQLAREYISGPTLIMFVDTISPTEDFSFLAEEPAEAVIWVKEVEDPRRFGVVEVDEAGWVAGMIEKPDDINNNRAIIGFYYFKQGETLLSAIAQQIKDNIQTKGEFYLADAMSIMLQGGLKMRPQTVDVWLDTGLPETVLETNRYLLENGRANSDEVAKREGVEIIPPVFIHPKAAIENSRIGPHVSIAEGCVVTGSKIVDSVLEHSAQVRDAELSASLIGARAQVQGVSGSLNIGEDAEVKQT
ncbi:MAG: nucleotidyltransferase [Chloroflexi bacterium]|nr:nucleotidyltransferase [Chloroflexota bacterium]